MVNKLLSGDVQGITALVDDSVKYWSVKKFAFPYELRERGFKVCRSIPWAVQDERYSLNDVVCDSSYPVGRNWRHYAPPRED